MITKVLYTLIFIKRDSELLLGYKTRGLGVGLWNGFGGKVEKEETLLSGALRELKEECNLSGKLNHLGVITYNVEDSERQDIVHIFTANSYQGNIVESEEMNPIRWFNKDKLPFDHMWPDVKLWFDDMLADKYFSLLVTYKKEMDSFISYEKKIYDDRWTFVNSINFDH